MEEVMDKEVEEGDGQNFIEAKKRT